MKVRGYLKGKGKLGNIVCSTVAGETIARDYNPEVANPNTEGQVDQRARFKLMSQLSSIMATLRSDSKRIQTVTQMCILCPCTTCIPCYS